MKWDFSLSKVHSPGLMHIFTVNTCILIQTQSSLKIIRGNHLLTTVITETEKQKTHFFYSKSNLEWILERLSVLETCVAEILQIRRRLWREETQDEPAWGVLDVGRHRETKKQFQSHCVLNGSCRRLQEPEEINPEVSSQRSCGQHEAKESR